MNRSRNSLKSIDNPQIALEELKGTRMNAHSEEEFVKAVDQLKNGAHYYMWILGGALRHTRQSLHQEDSNGQMVNFYEEFEASSSNPRLSSIKYTK